MCTKFIVSECLYFDSVPLDPIKRTEWIGAIETHQEFDHSICKYYICQLHFPAQFIRKAGARTDLLKGAVPTIFPQVCDIEYLDEDAVCVNKYINLQCNLSDDFKE